MGYSKAYIKQETLRLYNTLPQDPNERQQRLDIRDQIIELNYSFFGYVASHTFVDNVSTTYEDKMQSALMHFLECWWWFQYAEKYRTDLSFAVFFKPRLSEMVRRELNEVKYTVRRNICMEAGAKLNKHWTKVNYNDIEDLDLPYETLASLKAMFGTTYWADLDGYETYVDGTIQANNSPFDIPTDKYNTIEGLLIHEMIMNESKLTDKQLHSMADMYSLNYTDLLHAVPRAERDLYMQLQDRLDILSIFE